MTKKALTQAEHDQLGLELATMRDDLVRRTTRLKNSPGPAAAAAALTDAYRAIDRARSLLEDVCFQDHPATATTHTYWPIRSAPDSKESSVRTLTQKAIDLVGATPYRWGGPGGGGDGTD